MKERMNVNVLLCKDCDDQVTYVDKVFNNIVLKKETGSFNIVTWINTLEYTKNRFALLYFLRNVEESRAAYMGDVVFECSETKGTVKEGKGATSSVENSSQEVSVQRFEDVSFPWEGDYEILVYRYEEDEIEEARKMIIDEKYNEAQNGEKLVASYNFFVKREMN